MTSVRPPIRPFVCRRPVWEFANKVHRGLAGIEVYDGLIALVGEGFDFSIEIGDFLEPDGVAVRFSRPQSQPISSNTTVSALRHDDAVSQGGVGVDPVRRICGGRPSHCATR